VVQVYTGLGLAMCWLLQAHAVFVKVVLEWRNLPPLRELHFGLIFGLPLIPVVVLIVTGSYGHSPSSLGCLFNSKVRDSHMDIYIFFLPLAVICACGLVFLVAVMLKMARVFGQYIKVYKHKIQVHVDSPGSAALGTGTTKQLSYSESSVQSDTPAATRKSIIMASFQSNSSTATVPAPDKSTGPVKLQELDVQSLWGLMLYFRTPMLFLVFFFVVYMTVVMGGLGSTSSRNKYLDGVKEWGQCALDNYNGVDDSWHAVCGTHPKVRLPLLAREIFACVLAGQSVFISIIFGPGVVSFLYQEYLAVGRILRRVVYGRQTHEFVEAEPHPALQPNVVSAAATFGSGTGNAAGIAEESHEGAEEFNNMEVFSDTEERVVRVTAAGTVVDTPKKTIGSFN